MGCLLVFRFWQWSQPCGDGRMYQDLIHPRNCLRNNLVGPPAGFSWRMYLAHLGSGRHARALGQCALAKKQWSET